jgi:hypothetical protein
LLILVHRMKNCYNPFSIFCFRAMETCSRTRAAHIYPFTSHFSATQGPSPSIPNQLLSFMTYKWVLQASRIFCAVWSPTDPKSQQPRADSLCISRPQRAKWQWFSNGGREVEKSSEAVTECCVKNGVRDKCVYTHIGDESKRECEREDGMESRGLKEKQLFRRMKL